MVEKKGKYKVTNAVGTEGVAALLENSVVVEQAAGDGNGIPCPFPPTPPDPEPEPEPNPESQDVEALVQQAIADAVAPHASLAVDLQQQNQQLQQQLQAQSEALAKLKAVVNLGVRPSPNGGFPMTQMVLSTGRDRVAGVLAEFQQALESSPSVSYTNPQTGQRHTQREYSQAARVFLGNRDRLRHEIEQHARANGLLRGFGVQQAATVKTDIPPLLLDYLSMMLRETHTGRYVWHQIPTYALELGKGPGDTIQVARFRWLTEASATADRVLTPGTATTSNRQNITADSVSLTLQEVGLGKGSGSEPVSIPQFLTAYSMMSLETAVSQILGHDYEAWADLSIRTIAFSGSTIVYNHANSVTTDPTDLDTGSDGTLTEEFLYQLYAYAAGVNKIPCLPDGTLYLVTHDIGLAQLAASLAAKNRYLSGSSVEELTNMLSMAIGREVSGAVGYAGRIANFQVFSTNAHSCGAAGTEGAQNVTLGGTLGATLTRSSFVVGRAAIARAIGMEAEIRRNSNDDFQRDNSFIWIGHEKTGALDVDPSIDAEQQLRVIEVRTLDTAV